MRLDGAKTLSQEQIDAYLKHKGGAAPQLSIFCKFLNENFGTHLICKCPPKKKPVIANKGYDQIDDIDRKACEKAFIELVMLPKPLNDKQRLAWIDYALKYFHRHDIHLKKLSEINKGLMVLDVELETEISDTEEKIAFKELHFFRGDRSEYTVRSTLPRVKYKEYEIKPQNTRSIKKGDVLIENSNYSRYKGELHIALKDFENEGNTNVIGKISSSNFRFIDQIQPWQKFRLKKYNYRGDL